MKNRARKRINEGYTVLERLLRKLPNKVIFKQELELNGKGNIKILRKIMLQAEKIGSTKALKSHGSQWFKK